MRLVRRFWGGGYRYGFNGKELDPEGMGGGGSTYDYGFRIYNPQLGKFLSVDPLFKSYPWNSTYAFAENGPIENIDLDGLEKEHYTFIQHKDGTTEVKKTHSEALIESVWNWSTWSFEEKINQRKEYIVHGTYTNYLNGPWGLQKFTEPAILTFDSENEALNVKQNDFARSWTAYRFRLQQSLGNIHEEYKVSRPGTSHSVGYSKRKAAFDTHSGNWVKGSQSAAVEKFAKGVQGQVSTDFVKTRYHNKNTNIEVIVDNENGYFRIYDYNKNQYVGMDGKVPSTGTLKGQEAKNYIQSQTHIKDNDL
jgi:RHS repeat-associated protein